MMSMSARRSGVWPTWPSLPMVARPCDLRHTACGSKKSTSHCTTSTIQVDLDGIDPTKDTSLEGLGAAIDAISGLSAAITADGRLEIDSAGSDFEFTFSDDTSGVLTTLGINTYFSGSDARDIEANSVVAAAPGMIAATLEHSPGDNGNALALADLRDMTIDSLIGLSLTDTIVRENMEVQQQQISGVNADEETINLLSYQRVYHGSARFIAVVDELLQKQLAIV